MENSESYEKFMEKHFTTRALNRCNKREQSIVQEYVNRGFDVISGGWPDFVFYKDDGTTLFVEVKAKRKRKNGELSEQDPTEVQNKCHELLKRFGIKVIIERI